MYILAMIFHSSISQVQICTVKIFQSSQWYLVNSVYMHMPCQKFVHCVHTKPSPSPQPSSRSGAR